MLALPLAVRDASTGVRWALTDRGLTCRVRPTWVGTRPYTTTDGNIVRVLRRSAQVNSAGHLETIKRVTGTRRHPERDGRPVFLSALAEPGSSAPWDPSVELRPPRDYFAAHVGDAISIVRVPGLGEVPEVEATLVDAELIADVQQRGLVEVSFGYISYFVAAADVPVDGNEVVALGQWRNPETGVIEAFDAEGLCDPADPRVPDEMRPYLGGNHLAFAVPRGRGGPEVRALLDTMRSTLDTMEAPTLNRPVRAWALRRRVDESGVSGAGIVTLALEVEDGPVAAVWVTPTASAVAYESLASFTAIHIGAHAEGANELVPLCLGMPFSTEAPSTAASTPAITPETVPIIEPEDDAMPTETPPPPPPPTVEQLVQQLAEAKKLYDELAQRYQTLEAAMAALKASAEQSAATATEGAAQAQAQIDALVEELRPHREASLNARRAAGCDALGISADSEHGKLIIAATADDLDRTIVDSYYKLHPEAAAAVPDLPRKLSDPHWLRARADLLRERVSANRTSSGVSDGFRSSFASPTPSSSSSKPTSSQGLLDALQNNG